MSVSFASLVMEGTGVERLRGVGCRVVEGGSVLARIGAQDGKHNSPQATTPPRFEP